MAIGVDLSVKADLGVSPISSLPYVYSLRFHLTLGQATIVLHLLLVLLQMLLLQKKYSWFQLVQIPIGLLFGWFIDFAMPIVSWIEPGDYTAAAFYCLLSCAIVGLGVFLEIKARLTYLAGEGAAMALSQRFGLEFEQSKIKIDSALVVVAVLSSFVFLGHICGIREGTIAAAVMVGFFARLFNKTTNHITRRFAEFAEARR